MSASLRVCAVLAVVTGCVIDTEPEVASTTQATGTRCPIFYCGDNAATAGDGLLFDELDLGGQKNYAGVKLASTTLHREFGGVPMLGELTIVHDELYVIAGGVSYSGAALNGTVLTFQKPDTSESFEVLIVGYDQTQHFLAGDPEKVPTYLMKARGKDGKFTRYICNNDVLPTDADWPMALAHHALVYRGDRYDPDHKALIADNDPNSGWSFLACAGSAGGKMHMFRHTYAGSFDDFGNQRFYTSPNKRTTLLKAITADYCGNGVTQFTVNGTPLTFQANTGFFFPTLGTYSSYEAIWEENGVVCIDEPRRAHLAPAEYAYTRDEVEYKCGGVPIPKCVDSGMAASWTSHGYVRTANPPLP